MVWLNNTQNAQPQPIICVKTKVSSKGIVICTPKYDCFLYFDSKLCVNLLEALRIWTKEPNLGKYLWVHPDESEKVGFKIEPQLKGKKYELIFWSEVEGEFRTPAHSVTDPETNPFL